MGQLLATPSARPDRRELPSLVSLGRGGLATLGESASGESQRTHPHDHDVGSLRTQALLAAAATATDLLDTVSLPPALSAPPVPMGFRHYGLPDPRPTGPTLPWNPINGEVLTDMDAHYNTSLKFHHVSSAERSGFASTGALLTPWSLQVPAPLSRYHEVTYKLITSYASETESLVCSAIEAHEHSMQLLEALTKIFP